ncbi:MAG TPA: chemotaxis protein CheW, partial [Thermodesulfobacteriota bacterium]
MTRPAGASRDVLAIRTLGLDWGIAGDDIEEIVPHRTAVRAPGSAPFVEGIVRYRDGILPVVDLSRRFRLPAGAEPPPPPRPEARRTLVVRISGGLAGLTVDEVVGSRPVGAGGLAPLPRPVTSPIVRGCLVGDGEDLLVVLDARRILETDEPLDLPLPPGRRLGTAAESDTAARPGARVDPAPSRPASGARPAAPEPDAPAGPAPTPAAGNLDRPARPAVPPPPAHAARPPAPDAPPADRARPARPERGAGEYASTLPDAPSPSPTREPAAAARGAAREPAHPAPGATRESAPTPPAPARAAQSAPPGSPPVRREPGARPDSPPPRPEHPPAARP